jgi:hypothetical protein
LAISLVFPFQGLAIKVQEQKRDDAVNRLVPAAASVIRNWWRLRCVYHGDRFASTWKIYVLIQRRVNAPMPPGNRATRSASPTYAGARPLFPSKQPTSSIHTKLGHIRRKSITSIDDLPQRYVTAIKIIRMLKYSSACKKFHQAKKPVDLKDVVKESTQMNNRLSTTLSDIQRRLDMALGTSKPASYLSDEQKRQQSLSARIEQIEHITNDFEHKLDYLEHLALTLVENR